MIQRRYKQQTLEQALAQRQRAKARAQRRAGNVRFIARMQGVDVLESRTTLKKKIDDIASLIVRRRDLKAHAGLCLVCVVKERMCILKRSPNRIELAYHIVPRGDTMTRWDLRNMVGACGPCNQGELWSRATASRKALYARIHAELLGGGEIGRVALHDLEYLATQTLKMDRAQLIEKRDELKSFLERK